MNKQINFVIRDEGIDQNVITGNVEETLAYIKSYLDECEDGESIPLENIRRHDMTAEELESAPEV